jgi:hypothetical protein
MTSVAPASSRPAHNVLRLLTAIALSCSVVTSMRSQEVTKGGIDNPVAAVNFCKSLQTAVQAQDKTKVAGWINAYPIQVGQKNSVLVADRNDFVEKFDTIFSAGRRQALLSDTGCDLERNADGGGRIAHGMIYIDQRDDGAQTVIEYISPPDNYTTVYEDQAAFQTAANNFLIELQRAVAKEDPRAVAQLCMYPFSINGTEKQMIVEDRTQLIRGYSSIFTLSVRKAILSAKSATRMGWRGFMVGDGTLWFDLVYGAEVIHAGTVNIPTR